MIQKRLDWIDMAKGYGIIMVIIGHINWDLAHAIVYACHLPLFFFLSGYVFNTKDNLKTFTISKVKTILLPHFLLAIPMIYFIGRYEDGYSLQMIPYIILRFIIQNRMSTLWYLGCLFSLSFIFYLLLKKCRSPKLRWCILILLTILGLVYAQLGGPWLPWNIDTALAALPFFALGYAYKTHAQTIDSWYASKKTGIKILFGILALLICLITNMLTWAIAHEGLEMYWSQYGCEPLTYISAISGIIFFCILSKAFVWRPILYIGKNSLIYFAWHQAIVIPVLEEAFEKHKFSLWLYRAGLPQGLLQITEILLTILIMTIIVMVFNVCKRLLTNKFKTKVKA